MSRRAKRITFIVLGALFLIIALVGFYLIYNSVISYNFITLFGAFFVWSLSLLSIGIKFDSIIVTYTDRRDILIGGIGLAIWLIVGTISGSNYLMSKFSSLFNNNYTITIAVLVLMSFIGFLLVLYAAGIINAIIDTLSKRRSKEL